MDARKKKRLEAAGWKVGDAAEFLELTEPERRFIEVKHSLAEAFAAQRAEHGTQVAVARVLRSSQSRVAKMEAGDPSVSIDLLVRALLTLGATRAQIATAFSTNHRRTRHKKTSART